MKPYRPLFERRAGLLILIRMRVPGATDDLRAFDRRLGNRRLRKRRARIIAASNADFRDYVALCRRCDQRRG